MATQVAHPESIVETDWVAEHMNDAGVVLVEVDVDTAAYDQGHIPGAVGPGAASTPSSSNPPKSVVQPTVSVSGLGPITVDSLASFVGSLSGGQLELQYEGF